jgi:hypothetical protein
MPSIYARSSLELLPVFLLRLKSFSSFCKRLLAEPLDLTAYLIAHIFELAKGGEAQRVRESSCLSTTVAASVSQDVAFDTISVG